MRAALGFPEELYEKIYGKAGAVTERDSPYKVATPLYVEVELATELGKTMAEWHAMTWAERKMRVYHRMLKIEKEEWAHEEARKKAEREAKAREELEKNRPKTVSLDKVRY